MNSSSVPERIRGVDWMLAVAAALPLFLYAKTFINDWRGLVMLVLALLLGWVLVTYRTQRGWMIDAPRVALVVGGCVFFVVDTVVNHVGFEIWYELILVFGAFVPARTRSTIVRPVAVIALCTCIPMALFMGLAFQFFRG